MSKRLKVAEQLLPEQSTPVKILFSRSMACASEVALTPGEEVAVAFTENVLAALTEKDLTVPDET